MIEAVLLAVVVLLAGVVRVCVVEVEHSIVPTLRRHRLHGPRPTGHSPRPTTRRTSTCPRSTRGSRRTRWATSRPPRAVRRFRPDTGSLRCLAGDEPRDEPGHAARAELHARVQAPRDAGGRPARPAAADAKLAAGQAAAENTDDYVRTTVYLATVLFLVGISGHFRCAARASVSLSSAWSARHRRGHARHPARSAVTADDELIAEARWPMAAAVLAAMVLNGSCCRTIPALPGVAGAGARGRPAARGGPRRPRQDRSPVPVLASRIDRPRSDCSS